jgi:hypothetical protein
VASDFKEVITELNLGWLQHYLALCKAESDLSELAFANTAY